MAGARTSLAAPLRVVVMGASASVDTSFHGGPRADLGYPRVIEAELRAAGRPARVHVSALQANRTRHGLATWEREVDPWDPDVVILHYGQADMVHLFLPRWLERHANSLRRRPGRVQDTYRKVVLRPIWLALARVQTRLDARVDAGKLSRRQRLVTAELAQMVELSRTASSPLVLVPTLLRPGPPWQKWFPGAGARMETLNRTFADVVREAADPDVRTFPLAALVEDLIPEGYEPTPDGGHFTPPIHHAIGAAMAQEILQWAMQRPQPAAGGERYGGPHADL
jgi:lysophospholipase L1-like esterase